MCPQKKHREISMTKLCEQDRIEGDTIIIYDDSGPQFQVLRRLIIISKKKEKEYKITKTRNNKYQMQ